MERDKKEELNQSEVKIAEVKNQVEILDKKLNILLDGFLEGIVEGEIYKTKKNAIFEEKVKLQEKIATLEERGSASLEPLREFIEVASQCEKIARAKNNLQDLANLAKHVGSDFFLEDGRVSAVFKKGFETIRATPHARKIFELPATDSLCVGTP